MQTNGLPPADRTRKLGYFALSLSVFAVVTCAGAARGPGAQAPASSPPPAEASASAPRDAASLASSAVPQPAASGLPPGALSGLPRFQAALRGLASGARREPLRVLFMGDSHTAADFFPDALRKSLQSRYGSAGPGYLYVGLGVYRHAGVKVEREGKWRVRPKQPSLWMRQDDGVFGLGGIRVVPESEGSRVRMELQKDAVRGTAAWDVAYRLPTKSARFRVTVEGDAPRIVDHAAGGAGAIGHFAFETPPGAAVVIDGAASEPEIFGVVVESQGPGVVVDTLGINGARIGTPLAWEAEPWIAEARRRTPLLFVLAYGTNEVGDQVAPFRYGPELASLVGRVRAAAPDAECLVVGPTDRAGPDFATLPRVAEIEAVEERTARENGCAFFSAFRAMGGEGSLRRWAAEEPPLAAPDHVHLTPRGYGELGAALSGLVLGEAGARTP